MIARRLGVALLGAAMALGASMVPAMADWNTYHFDNTHNGYDAGAPAFSSVSAKWTTANGAIDGDILAEPLYSSGKVYVVTMNDTLYALDPASGATIWSNHLANPCPAACIPSGDSIPSATVGIMSTPVIDPVANVLYAVGMNSSSLYKLWAVDLSGTTHGLKYPAVSVDPPRDPGQHSTQAGQNGAQNQRGALALGSNGTLYIPYGGRAGDCCGYHGYVVGVQGVATATRTVINYHTPFTSGEAGMWSSGGVAIDPNGNLFVSTGNGSSSDPANYDQGNSVLKLSPTLSLLDSWAPTDWAPLSGSDTDIGSTGPTLIGSSLVFQSGKDGKGYLLNQGNLGGIGLGNEVQSTQVCSGTESMGGHAYAFPYIYMPCEQDGLYGLKLSGSSPTSTFSKFWHQSGFTAGPPIVAAGAVWVIDSAGSNLFAFNPSDGAQLAKLPIAGSVMHFVTPSEGGGSIYVPGAGFVQAFSFAPVVAPVWSASYDMSTAPTNWVAGQSQTFPVKVTNTGNQNWPSTGYTEVDLDLHFATSAGGSTNQARWLYSLAFSLPANLAPAASVTLNVTVTAPAGALVLEAEMIKEHQFWFQQWSPVNVAVTGPTWSASYDMSKAPTNWVAGQGQTFPVKVTNSGNQIWPSTGYTEVDLDIHFATSSGGSSNQAHWLYSLAFSLPANLAPAASVTLNVTVTAPKGALVLEAEMIKEHQFWFQQSQSVTVTVAAPIWKAGYDLSKAPTNWLAGHSQAFQVTVTNLGNIAWPSTGYTEVDLDLHFATSAGGSANQAHWLYSLAFSIPANLAPAASVTLNVTVTAPPGSLVLEAEMIKEHQFWFQQVASVQVTVS